MRSTTIARLVLATSALASFGCGAAADGPTGSGDAVASLQLSGLPDTLAVGETVTATATAALSGGGSRPVRSGWSANPSWLVSLSPSGDGESIAASGAGTVTITVTEGSRSASKNVVVLFERYQRLSALFSDTLRVGRVMTPPVTGEKSGDVTVGVFDAIVRSSDTSVVAVSGRTLTAVAPGRADLLFESGGARVTRHVTVEAPPVIIDVRIVGAVSPVLAQAAKSAVARWQDIFASSWTNTAVSMAASECVAGQPAVTNETITGVRLYVAENNAGVAGALARSGACVSTADGRTVVGRIYVGLDLERATTATKLAVMTHELGHVFGLMAPSMITDVPGPNPRWIGPEARRQFLLAGGADVGGVPLETETEVPSGAYGHWRISSMPDEIMTTFAGRLGNRPEGGPLSAITLGALTDLGYPIRLSAADPYRVDKKVPTSLASANVASRHAR
ncbi:MAG TPA: hypothetical protein VGP25_14675 [Gemmatimonadaceae bacterium]|nr:hypothetical protein [Gemmatimonadaceae bacterium]